MNGHCLTNEQILAFSTALFLAERSQATMEKYLRSVRAFSLFLDGQPVTKDTVMAWKKHFQREESYSPSTINILPQHLLRDTSVMRCGLRGLATSAVPECTHVSYGLVLRHFMNVHDGVVGTGVSQHSHEIFPSARFSRLCLAQFKPKAIPQRG